MFDVIKKQIEWGGATLTLETGRIARQATSAVFASIGETVVLCTVVGKKDSAPDASFFPLTVHYQDRFYATGRIPGGFIKRENKPTEREVLTSRLIDRPLRPLFPEMYHNEVQIICTVLSYDGVNDPDILSIIGASAALTISEIPFAEAVGAARVGYKNGEFTLNQVKSSESELELIVAGTKNSILMVESEAKELSESVMLDAINYGHEAFKPVIKMINGLAKEVKKEKWGFEAVNDKELAKKLNTLIGKDISKAYSEPKKQLREILIDEASKKAISSLVSEEITEKAIKTELNLICQKIVRNMIIKDQTRIDGRKLDEIRPITCELDLLPRVHGSALFTRGETQAIVTTTIGTSQDEQMVDDLLGNKSDNLMLHYNFPPYAVGESHMLRAPGRREIGHGKLALKAITPVTPTKEAFPYTIRIVSEITESNGSSSMATVCGASLAMMAAGIPMKKPVAGIAMGLIKEGEEFAVLSDIMGDEDKLGDMDFKVAGTKEGITALQMDIKIGGISSEIMKIALDQAVKGIEHISNEMAKTIKEARKDASPYAPKVVSIQIDKEKIREVIGSGGKVIRDICEKSGAKVDIEETGKINVSGVTAESIEIALKMISEITAVPEVGKIYEGVVTKLMSFGAFVRFLGAIEGLLHISEFSNDRTENIEDVLSEGDAITVQVVGLERGGKVRLSVKSIINGNLSSYESSSSSSGSRSGGGSDRPRSRPSSGFGGRSGGSSDRPRGRPSSGFGGRSDRGGERSSSSDRPRSSRPPSDFGGRSDRGGERSDRGGERSSSRGGERSDRGGERSSSRGGERSDRGGERSSSYNTRTGPRSDNFGEDKQKRRRFF